MTDRQSAEARLKVAMDDPCFPDRSVALAREAISFLRWVLAKHPHGDLPSKKCCICNSKELKRWLDGEI